MMNGVPFLAATITLTALSTPLYFSKGFNFRSTLRLFPFDRCEAMNSAQNHLIFDLQKAPFVSAVLYWSL